MLNLILIDVKYSQLAVFNFEKGSNHQSPQQNFRIPPTPHRYLENPDIW